MKRLSVTRNASKDLDSIWEYIAADNIDEADRVIAAIDAALENLCATPGMGHERNDVPNPNYRFWRVYSYILAYRIRGNTLYLSRVIHGARDFRHLFPKRN